MSKLSENFSLAEFTRSQKAARLGINNTPTGKALENLKNTAEFMEIVRELLGSKPIHISSGYRCLRLNRSLGSSDSSCHVQGWAVDFTCPKFGTPFEICQKIVASGLHFHQLIWEGAQSATPDDDWVHISFNPKSERKVMTARFVNGRPSYTPGLK